MRVFVAVPMPGSIAEELERWMRNHRQVVPFRKWTHPKDYHITLQFLGEMPEAKLHELDEALKGVRWSPLALALNGGGTFGPPKAPRVLWSGVAGDRDGLKELHTKVVQATRPLGFVPEDRPYAAHITLARGFVSGAGMPVEALASLPSGHDWQADRFVLMRTHMNASPMYESIGEYPLQP